MPESSGFALYINSLELDSIFMTKVTTPNLVESFPAGQAARLAGLSLAMVNYLCRNEIVLPTLGDKRGRGVRRQYSFSDVLLLRVVARMLEHGISVLRLKKSLLGLRTRAGGLTTDMLTKKYLLIDGHDVFIQDGELLETLETGQIAFAFVMELDSLRVDLRANLLKTAC